MEAPLEEELSEWTDALSAARAATLDAIDAQLWPKALNAAKQCCTLSERLLPAVSPALGIEWLRVAKLYANAEQIEAAVDAWRRARAILSVTHGDSSSLLKTLEADLGSLESEQAALAALHLRDDE